MSFLESIRHKRSVLNHITTRVTTVGGKVLHEEMSNGLGTVIEIAKERDDCPGFIIDSNPDLQMAEIVPLLYLGSQDVTQESTILRNHKVTHIISIGVNVPHLEDMPHLKYYYFPALDTPDADLKPLLSLLLPVMKRILDDSGCLFVHCNAGISRGPSVVIAYLMTYHGLSFNNAHQKVLIKRHTVKPNPGFIEQLRRYETELKLSPLS